MRHHHTCIVSLAALAALLTACAGSKNEGRPDPEASAPPAASEAAPSTADPGATATPSAAKPAAELPRPKPLDPLRNQPNLPPEKRLVVVIDGEERIVDVDAARSAGYSVVDFSNDWTPYIFERVMGRDGEMLENRYREIFLGLADDRTDGDGRALRKSELNFLEVFGIPPSMRVVQKRFLDDDAKACHKEIDYAAIAAADRIPFLTGRNKRKYQARLSRARKAIKKALKKAKVETTEELEANHPKIAKSVAESMELIETYDTRMAAFAEVEKRLDCDEHNRKRFKHKKGRFDEGLRRGLRRFQRKHKLYEYANMKNKTMEMLGMPPMQTNFLAFERVMRERVIAATHIIEDGTTQTGDEPPTYTGTDGKTYPVRNLVEEFTQAALTQLQLDTPERVLAFFKRYAVEDLEWLQVGVKFPELPEYYADHMELDIVIDRGDVWYDLPYKDDGSPKRQRRARMPKLSLYLNWNDQRIRLVRWPTTIGGWRKDLAPNGYTYMRYKGSEIGRRVIRKIISGPAWVPPESTPLKSMAKRQWINGKGQSIVNYAEMGPGYLSAYGLVAGYFVIPGREGRGDVDQGIRAHGSSDYMSIRSSRRFSHGCHRLLNHLSVRLYGFILNHRTHEVAGDQIMNHQRTFYHSEKVYHVRMPSRGFAYTLDPPLPVNVLKGRIRGDRKKPYEGYVQIPGKEYPGGDPKEPAGGEEDRAGGGGEGLDEDDA